MPVIRSRQALDDDITTTTTTTTTASATVSARVEARPQDECRRRHSQLQDFNHNHCCKKKGDSQFGFNCHHTVEEQQQQQAAIGHKQLTGSSTPANKFNREKTKTRATRTTRTTMPSKHLMWLVWRSGGILIHLIAFSIYTFLLVRDQYLRYQSSRLFEFPGPWKFLTFWDIWLQFITFSLCLICDCLPHSYSLECHQNLVSITSSGLAQSGQSIKSHAAKSDIINLDNPIDSGNMRQQQTNQDSNRNNTTNQLASHSSSTKLTATDSAPNTSNCNCFVHLFNARKLFNLRDDIITALAYPIGTFVTIMFWTIYLIDVNSIASPELRRATPWYVQHLQHTVVAPLILLEIVVSHHRVICTRRHLMAITIFMTSYIIWLLFLGVYMQIWAYPLFEKLTWWQTGLFLMLTCCCAMALYRFGLFIIHLTWPEKRIQQFYKSHMESYAFNEQRNH